MGVKTITICPDFDNSTCSLFSPLSKYNSFGYLDCRSSAPSPRCSLDGHDLGHTGSKSPESEWGARTAVGLRTREASMTAWPHGDMHENVPPPLPSQFTNNDICPISFLRYFSSASLDASRP